MNRRTLIAGSAALAVSTAIPAPVAAGVPLPSPKALEFVTLLKTLTRAQLVQLAGIYRAMVVEQGAPTIFNRIADLVEQYEP